MSVDCPRPERVVVTGGSFGPHYAAGKAAVLSLVLAGGITGQTVVDGGRHFR